MGKLPSIAPSIEHVAMRQQNVDDYLIRLMDVLGSILVLISLTPFLPLIALLIRLDSVGSPIFKQKRVGQNASIFTMYKFRTMCIGADSLPQKFRNDTEPVVKIVNDNRITRLGTLLRKFGIDELPQLVNILKGDMSFVGARPPVLSEFSAYNEYQKQRVVGRPGLASLAHLRESRQLMLGGEPIAFDETVKLDIYYHRNRSVYLYLKILLKIIPCCLSGKSMY